MKLYHGTSESAVSQILSEGIKPRKYTEVSNWDHCFPSCESNVYLTSCYAPYYAYCASPELESKWAIIEVDTDRLDSKGMRPDEDFIVQAVGTCKDAEPGTLAELLKQVDKDDVHKHVMNNLDSLAGFWESSISHLGTCSYKGTIPTDAIDRVSVFDPAKFPDIYFLVDPVISLMNYTVCGNRYKAVTRLLMGDEVDPEEAGYLCKEMAGVWKELDPKGYSETIKAVTSFSSELVYSK